MRVLILTPFYPSNIGGLETHLADLTRYLCGRGHKVWVVTYTPLTIWVKNVPCREVGENLDVYRLKWVGHGLFFTFEPHPLLQFPYLFPLFFHALFLTRKIRPDVIHAHGLVAALITKLIAKLWRARTVMSIHGIYGLERRPLLAKAVWWILLSFDRVLALSERSKRDFMDVGLSAERIWICMQWVDQLGRFHHKALIFW